MTVIPTPTRYVIRSRNFKLSRDARRVVNGSKACSKGSIWCRGGHPFLDEAPVADCRVVGTVGDVPVFPLRHTPLYGRREATSSKDVAGGAALFFGKD